MDKLSTKLSKRAKSTERKPRTEEFAIDTGDDDWWNWQDDEPHNVPVLAATVTSTRTEPTRMSVARSSRDGNGDPDDYGDDDGDKVKSKKDKKEKKDKR